MEIESKIEKRLNEQVVTSFYQRGETFGRLDHEPRYRGQKLWFTRSGVILAQNDIKAWMHTPPEIHNKIYVFAKAKMHQALKGKGLDEKNVDNRIFREEIVAVRSWTKEEGGCGGCMDCS